MLMKIITKITVEKWIINEIPPNVYNIYKF